MTEKLFKLEKWSDRSLYFYDDIKQYSTHNSISSVCEEVEKRLNELAEEVMSLRGENTKLKLTLKDIVEDLEKEAERGSPLIIRQEYVDWIKDNVDLRLNSERKK